MIGFFVGVFTGAILTNRRRSKQIARYAYYTLKDKIYRMKEKKYQNMEMPIYPIDTINQ